jgi:tripartite-type tricarboxylate transporter receptor subunit TctC
VVENKPGGNTTIGNNYVAKSAGDGYTILVTPLPFSALPALYGSKLPYDALNDFQALILAGVANNVLATRKGLGIKDVNELIAYAKKNPGKLNYGSTGSGSSNHLSMELLMSMTGIKLTHVPYKGMPQAVADVAGNQIQAVLTTLPAAIPFIQSGKVIPLATSGLKRSSILPHVPTISESGYKGFIYEPWYGFLGPNGMSKAQIDVLSNLIVEASNNPEMANKLTIEGIEMRPTPHQDFQKILYEDYVKWGDIIGKLGIKGQ